MPLFVHEQAGTMMNLRERVERLVKYCGQYQAHGFMIDERNQDASFDIRMPEEKEICEKIKDLKIILLTGEAGDGKSRLLRNVKSTLTEYGFAEPCSDFSALSEEDKAALIKRMRAVLDGKSEEKLFILANIGVFTQAVLQNDMEMMEQLTASRQDVFVCNFENRNLAEHAETFQEIVNAFLTYEDRQGCEGCRWSGRCAYQENIDAILAEQGTDAIRTICNAIYLTGGHVTFRELLSMLAYMVSFGESCAERQQKWDGALSMDEEDWDKILYYNVFEKNGDLLLDKISCMDPAKKRGEENRESLPRMNGKRAYIRWRRKNFFQYEGDKYQLLNVDYLVEFYKTLEYMNQPPYNYDMAKDKNPVLQELKRGIKKMANRGKDDTGLVVTDTPLIFDNQIRTEFMVMQDMSMIWHRYDMQIGKKTEKPERIWNKFYLSYLWKGENSGDRKLISLLIDYKQFRYLMMCSKDYFMNKNELSVEEYAVNTFYRKILQESKQAYDAIVIRFDENVDGVCDFSLMVHTSEDIFAEEQSTTIRIKRED